MDQEKIENLILKISAKTKIPPIPNKKDSWDNLIHLIDNSKTKSQPKKINPYQYIENIWSYFSFKKKYDLILPLAIILSLPLYLLLDQSNTFRTESGERLSMLLPDSSKVILNSESTITYKKTFHKNHRTLHLKGEAYFDVKTLKTPFIVETEHGNITVLGTTFNVRSRKDGFEVGVNTGKVKVTNEQSFLELNPKQCIMDKHNFNEKKITKIDYEKYPGWINQKLHCKHTDLATVCKEIERIHNIKIQFSNRSLENITITGVIDTSDLKTMLNTVSLLTQHRFKFDNGIYTII